MGLTDLKEKVIYISDGMSVMDEQDTLAHEFLHMRGMKVHDEKFAIAEHILKKRAERLRILYDRGIE